MNFGKKLKELRESVGISQNKLAKRLNLKSPQSISNIERDIAPLPARHLVSISDILEINIDTLIDYMCDDYKTKLRGKVEKENQATECGRNN